MTARVAATLDRAEILVSMTRPVWVEPTSLEIWAVSTPLRACRLTVDRQRRMSRPVMTLVIPKAPSLLQH